MKTIVILYALLSWGSLSVAGPGTHGPNGEHLDAPSGAVVSAGLAVPRLEASTEEFELLARLYDDEMSIVIDRFATNEPVMGGKVEAEALGLKAVGEFHPDHGDYSISDPAFLKALRQPGKHPVVFTVLTEKETDMIEGVIDVGAAQAGSHSHAGDDHDDHHDHAHAPVWQKAVIVIAATLLLAGFGWWRRRRVHSRKV